MRLLFALAALCSISLNIFGLAWLHQNKHNVDALMADSMSVFLPVGMDQIDSKATATATESSGDRINNHKHKPLFLRFDEAAPKELPGWSRSHALPNAVPPHRVIPDHQVENEAYHKQKRTNTSTNNPSILGLKGRTKPYYSDGDRSGSYNWDHSYQVNQDDRALYLYNPSVLPLYQDAFHPKDWQALTGGTTTETTIKYLATFRANTGGNCFGSDRPAVMQEGEQVSYLAVALLDANLHLIPGTDVLIDINAGPTGVGERSYWRQFQEDCKPIQMKTQLYFLCNERLFAVKIVRRNATTTTPLHTERDRGIPYTYPNIYGHGLEITLLSQQKLAGGKNFNVFRAPSETKDSDDYYLQVYPLPHRYHRLTLPADNNDAAVKIGVEREQQSTKPLPPPSFHGPDTPNRITTCPENERPSTWITNCTDPDDKPFFGDSDHGTACCVSITIPELSNSTDTDTVLVGISHTKTSGITNPWWLRDIHGRYRRDDRSTTIASKRYLSRLVAYQSRPPFDIVARSGWFCLGFGSVNQVGGNNLAGRNVQYKMDLFDENDNTTDCPMVHFASGFSEFVGDSSKAIISYGVADCYPRMIVVEKEDIARRLLGTAS